MYFHTLIGKDMEYVLQKETLINDYL